MQHILLHVLLSTVVLGGSQQAIACQDNAPQYTLHKKEPCFVSSDPERDPQHPSAPSSSAAIIFPEPRFEFDDVCWILYSPPQDTYRSGRRMLSRHKQLQQGIHYARGPP